MGRMQAESMLELGTETGMSLDAILRWHLTGNHYPPLPLSLIDTCKKVIEHANDGDYEAEVELPDGLEFQGSNTAPVHECIRAWHLDTFIEQHA